MSTRLRRNRLLSRTLLAVGGQQWNRVAKHPFMRTGIVNPLSGQLA
jgi:hypothetical protein